MRITFSSYSTPSLLSFFNHFYLCLSLPQQSSLKAIRYGLAGKYFLLNGKESWLHKAGFSAVGYEEGLHTGERRVRKGSPSRRGGHCNIWYRTYVRWGWDPNVGGTDRPLQGPGAQSGYRVLCAMEWFGNGCWSMDRRWRVLHRWVVADARHSVSNLE